MQKNIDQMTTVLMAGGSSIGTGSVDRPEAVALSWALSSFSATKQQKWHMNLFGGRIRIRCIGHNEYTSEDASQLHRYTVRHAAMVRLDRTGVCIVPASLYS